MSTLHTIHDDELWQWRLESERRPGPAGTATTELTAGVLLHVDALDGTLLSLVVDADDARGRVGAEAEDVVRRLFGGDLRADADVELQPELADLVVRLALLEDAASARELVAPAAASWQEEATALRIEAGLPTPTGARPGAVPTGASATPTGPVDPAVAHAFRSRSHELGRISTDGHVALDMSFVRGQLLDTSSARSTFSVDENRLALTLGVRHGVYVAEVQAVNAVVIDTADDLVIATAPLGVGPGPDGQLAVVGDLIVSGARDLVALELALTEDPAHLPSPRLRSARRATHLARDAAQAARLGLDDAASLLARSLEVWSTLGVVPSAAGVESAERTPFQGELDDLAADLPPAN